MKWNAALYPTLIILAKCSMWLLYRHKTYGIQNYPRGGAIIAANHVSFLDPICVAISCPERIHFLARHTLFTPMFGKLIRAVNTYPVGPLKVTAASMRTTQRILDNGGKVLIFPEGQRSATNSIDEIKPGISSFINKSKIPIIPTYIGGTFEAWNKNKKFPALFKHRTYVAFGPKINPSEIECDGINIHKNTESVLLNRLNLLKNMYDDK